MGAKINLQKSLKSQELESYLSDISIQKILDTFMQMNSKLKLKFIYAFLPEKDLLLISQGPESDRQPPVVAF